MEQDLETVKLLKSQCAMVAGARQAFGSQSAWDDSAVYHCKALHRTLVCALLKSQIDGIKGVDLKVNQDHCSGWNLREAKYGRSLESDVLYHVKNLYSKTQSDEAVMQTTASVVRVTMAIEDGVLDPNVLNEQ